MGQLLNRIKSIRKQANRTTNLKSNKVTINHDDFWMMDEHIMKIGIVELVEKNNELIEEIRLYRKSFRHMATLHPDFKDVANKILNQRLDPVEEVVEEETV